MKSASFRRLALGLLAGFGPMTNPAEADAVAEFYRGKTITFLVGSDPGGSFGPYAQVLAEHMGKHIPANPRIIVKFTGGQGGGIHVGNQMHSAVARDGLTIGMTQQTIVLNQVLYPDSAKYDAREWVWLGNMAPIRNMLAVWHTAKAQSVEAARGAEVIVGATGASSPTYIVPNVMNKFLGTKFKIVTGYKGAADLNLAIERGEIEGRGASWLSVELAKPDWIRERKIKVIAFASMTRDPTAPAVPTLAELVKDPNQRKAVEFISSESDFGRSVFLPPGVPADRVAALRKAFEATMKDADFLAEAKKQRLPIEPTSADVLATLTSQVLATPKEIVALAQ